MQVKNPDAKISLVDFEGGKSANASETTEGGFSP